MKSIRALQIAMALATIGNTDSYMYGSEEKRSLKDIDFKPKYPPTPKGCKQYIFKEDFGTLAVIAISQKSALKKYNKWCLEHKMKNIKDIIVG